MEERGFDTAPTAGGLFELLRDVVEVVPGVLELEVEEVLAGLRPTTPDNLPAIGAGALDGPVLGDRPPPQRDPAVPACPASWPPPRCAASRRPPGRPPSIPRASRARRCRA